MAFLHVTNGDIAADGLRQAALPGTVLPWRDVLHDGPVLPDESPTAFREARAQFLSERGWSTPEAIAADFAARDAALDAATADDTVVLWFEPDLYDQLQLLQVLARLARRPSERRPAIQIVPADLLLGPLEGPRFALLHEARRAITAADLTIARLAWQAYTAPQPDALPAIVDQLDQTITARSYASDTAVRLPYVSMAIRRVLEEYPDVQTGLSRSERQICEALEPGRITLAKLFPAAHQATESWPWLGDASFAWYVERLSSGSQPILTHDNGSRVLALTERHRGRTFWDRTVQLTPFGLEVLQGRADQIRINGIDRWIGGVHCTTAQHWRWDDRRRQLRASP